MFAAVVCIIALGLPGRGPSARYALWFTAAAKFAIPAALFSALGLRIGSVLPANYSLVADSATVPSAVFNILSTQLVSEALPTSL